MSGALKCESCEKSPACKLKDDGFTDLCPENKPKRIVKTKQKSKQQFDSNKLNHTKKIQKSEKEKRSKLEKRQILKDIEKGHDEPAIRGLKRTKDILADSKPAKKAKEMPLNNF